jgi:hypothetical protein
MIIRAQTKAMPRKIESLRYSPWDGGPLMLVAISAFAKGFVAIIFQKFYKADLSGLQVSAAGDCHSPQTGFRGLY